MAAKKLPLKELEQYLPLSKVIEFAQNLIRIPSLSGDELRCVQTCLQQGKRLGFETQIDPLGNYIGRIKVGSGSGKKIILSGHLDTVHAQAAQWSEGTQPYSGSVQEDKLYGRGASDMKAALAAMHQAAFAISHLKQGFSGEVFVVGTVVEELFEGVCFLEAMEQIQPDYVIIGEASQCNLNIGQRGRAEVSVAVSGVSTHACMGRTTINPIEQAAYVVDSFHRFYQAEKDDLLGERIIVPTNIQIPAGFGGGLDGRGGNSTVPSRVDLTYDVRTLPGDTPESILALMRKELTRMIDKGSQRYPNFQAPVLQVASDSASTHTGVKLNQPKFAPAWKTNSDSEIVRRAVSGLEQAGLSAKLGAYSFCTDGSAIVPYRLRHTDSDCQIVGYGPSLESLAHVTDEYIELKQLQQAVRGYTAILAELLRI